MSRPQENREIDITAPARKGSGPGAAGRAAGLTGRRTRGTAGRAKQHGTARASSARPGGAKAHAGAGQAGTRPAGARGKRTGRRRAGIAALAVLLVLAALAGGAYLYVDSLIDAATWAALTMFRPRQHQCGASIVPPDFAGVRNLLVLGLDYEAEGPVARDEKHPNTDMILYVRLDGNAHSMTMLQIPRDVFVGEAGGAAGKINGILAKNVDIGDGNGLCAVKTYIETNFGLPIDDYVTIDMDALTEMVDAFGGVEVYVPQNMRYYNEKTGALEGELLQGWRTLLGGDCEFFLRYRQGLPRSDLDRLVMQRQFYAGLFRRLKTASVGDIVKLLPVAQKYIKTDISTLELMSIAIEVSGMDSADISIGRLRSTGRASSMRASTALW
ncbi:MAG: LCP family protein [Ruthenibacterium lactatiformans]